MAQCRAEAPPETTVGEGHRTRCWLHIPAAWDGRPLVEVSDLIKHFPVRRGGLGWSTVLVRAVDSISFTLEPGRTLGLVGESGCGKTTTSKLILGLERPTAGVIRFSGQDVLALDREGRRHWRRSVQAVFQDPYASLDPRMRVGTIVAEPIVIAGELHSRARGPAGGRAP